MLRSRGEPLLYLTGVQEIKEETEDVHSMSKSNRPREKRKLVSCYTGHEVHNLYFNIMILELVIILIIYLRMKTG